MSEITFACPHCGVQLSATDELFGQVTNCPSCNQPFQIPSPQAVPGMPGGPRPAPTRPGPVARGPQPGGAQQPMGAPQRQYSQPDYGYESGPQQGLQPGPAAAPPGPNPRQRYAVMQTTDWMVVLLLVMLPFVGIVMLFIWAFSDGNLNRRNYARAQLIFVGILSILGILVMLFTSPLVKRAIERANTPPPAPIQH